jgi:hypothetical protein
MGLSVIDRVTEAAVTVNVAEAESPVEPVATIVYTPTATLATIKEAVRVPPEIVQVEVTTPPPDNEQLASFAENPEPVTKTIEPA